MITEARIEISNPRAKVGPNAIRAGRSPGFEPYVFTETGRLGVDDGCYVGWKLYSNGKLVDTRDTRCERTGGFSEAYWPSNVDLESGTAKVIAEITTDWDASASAELSLTVR